MEFRKVWYDGTTIHLEWDDPLPGGAVDKHAFECAEAPAPKFKDALQAFGPFAVGLLDLPDHWVDGVTVRSLAIKTEEKTGACGLQVTVMRKITKAKNRPVVITTPYLAEPPADYTGDPEGYLDDVTLKLLDELERQAEAYRDGERGEQTKLALGDENVKAFDDRAAAAEVASTRKPKGSKKRTEKAALAAQADASVPVVNPNAGIPLTTDALRQLLLAVERDVPVDAIERWLSSERDAAQRWAEARQKEIIGQLESPMMPTEPACILRDATPALADGWTDQKPPRVNDNGVQAVQAAVEHGTEVAEPTEATEASA